MSTDYSQAQIKTKSRPLKDFKAILKCFKMTDVKSASPIQRLILGFF